MGSVSMLIDRARNAGLSVVADGDRLVINGPRRAAAIASELMGRKAEVMAALAPPPEIPEPYFDEDSVTIPRDWRWSVSSLPHDEWVRWRRRSQEIQEALGHPPSFLEIAESYRQAAAEFGKLG